MMSWSRWLVEPDPPGLGMDLREEELSLVRLAEKRSSPEIDLCFTSPLPPGVVRFSMLHPNVLDEEAFSQAVENALVRGGAANRKRAAITLPDHVARIAVMELPEAPRETAELAELMKFRAKKTLPFDVEHARVAFERLPGPVPSFLTGFMHEAVARQYEELFSRLGIHLGLLLPASVSLLQLLRPVARQELAPGSDYFFVNVERDYFSISLVRNREVPVLARTLGLRSGEARPGPFEEEDLLQEIIPTAIYYREKLAGDSLERVYYRSLRPDLTRLREILEDQFEAPTEPFHLMKMVGVSRGLQIDAAMADSVGAAASAAAGRAA